MSDKKPEGLNGFQGLAPSYTLPSGREISAGEAVHLGFQAYQRANLDPGDPEDSITAANWNEEEPDTRRHYVTSAIATLADAERSNSAAADQANIGDTLIDLTGREMGRALIDAAMTEIKLQQRPWEAMTADQQSEVLERVSSQVRHAVGNALRQLATRGATHITCELEQITVKKAAKLTLTLPRGEVAEDLLEAVGQAVILVIGGALEEGEIQTPKPEPDQRALELAAPPAADAGEDD